MMKGGIQYYEEPMNIILKDERMPHARTYSLVNINCGETYAWFSDLNSFVYFVFPRLRERFNYRSRRGKTKTSSRFCRQS